MPNKKISYVGPSMNPTLKVPDMIEVIPYNNQSEIRVGDIIVFKSPKNRIKVVHRVASISKNAIKTRGDNNSRADNFVLSPKDILGKVVSAQRIKKRRTIWGGIPGQFYCGLIRFCRLIVQLFFKLGHHPYHLLAKTNIIRRFLPLQSSTKIVIFKNRKQLLWGKRVIGQFLPGKGNWQIFRPFRLFIDEKKLPC